MPRDYREAGLPNYRDYWMADSDAVNSLDSFEAYVWFISRGDECLNCGSRMEMMRTRDMPLVIRVKPARLEGQAANLPREELCCAGR